MSQCQLNYAAIDLLSESVVSFLSNAKVDSKDVQRLRLSVEEVLLIYLNHFGEGKTFSFKTSTHFRSLMIELFIPGESFDPFSDQEGQDSAVLHNLLSGVGLAPAWRYKNGKNIVVFAAKKKKMSQVALLGIAILAALLMGGLFSFLPQGLSTFITQDVITPVFNTFMGLLAAISGPIVFLSVVWGILGIGDMTIFGKVGKKMISRFIIFSMVIGAAGTALCAAFFEISATGETAFAFSDLYQMILDIIPGNFLTPFTEGNSLQIIFIAFVVGIAMLVLGNRVSAVTTFIDQANVIMKLIMGAVSAFIPFFVFGSILNMVAGNNFSAIIRAYKMILVMLLADVLLIAVYTLVISVRKKVKPFLLLKKVMPTFVIALTTASAVAAYQTNIDCCEKKLGVDKKIIDIGIPLGQVIFMPGAILLFLCTSFGMAESYGIAITPIWLLTAFIISVVLAIAAPPVPGAALTCYTILFIQLGIPTEAIAVVIALNVILEFAATAINVFGLQMEIIELSDSLDYLDKEVLRK